MKIKQISEKTLRQRIVVKIKKVAGFDGCIAGSLVQIHRKCGRPTCRCATTGEKHPAFVLTSKVNRKTKAVYIPVGMVEEVRTWVENYRQIKNLLKEIDELSEQIIRQKVPASRAVARNKKLLNQ